MSRDYRSSFYPESRFGGFTDIDGTIAFFVRVNALIETSSVVLDVGCGRGAFMDDPVAVRREMRVLKGKCRTVIGIDVDPAASGNPYIDEFILVEDDRWALGDASVDVG